MKIYEITLFLIMLNVSFNVVNSMGIWGDSQIYYGGDIAGALRSESPQAGAQQSYSALQTIAATFGLLLDALVKLLFIIAYSTILFPVMLSQVGLNPLTDPTGIGLALTTGYWLSLIIGYLQFISRTNIQAAE